jgi:hypothetical protein
MLLDLKLFDENNYSIYYSDFADISFKNEVSLKFKKVLDEFSSNICKFVKYINNVNMYKENVNINFVNLYYARTGDVCEM